MNSKIVAISPSSDSLHKSISPGIWPNCVDKVSGDYLALAQWCGYERGVDRRHIDLSNFYGATKSCWMLENDMPMLGVWRIIVDPVNISLLHPESRPYLTARQDENATKSVLAVIGSSPTWPRMF